MTSDRQAFQASTLLSAVRSRRTLWKAWFKVYPRAKYSPHDATRKAARAFKSNPATNIESLQSRLSRQSFLFSPQRGVAKKRAGKTPRPVIVSPLENRIVQRAILDVLQCPPERLKAQLAPVSRVLETPTSVGGLPGKGVPEAVNLITGAIQAGATHYIRSDIKDFFGAIPKEKVIEFIRATTKDDAFTDFFEAALQVELANESEIREWLSLFPRGDIGVPQGSALSALCANILLREFDRDTNSADSTTVRYIDDFVVLANTEQAANAAYSRGKKIMESLGLSLHDPLQHSEKASIGEVSKGFEFLSYRFMGKEVSASKAARGKLEGMVRQEIKDAKKTIMENLNAPRRTSEKYIQVLSRLDRKIRGWADSFAYSTRRLEFAQLDDKIFEMLDEFSVWFYRKTKNLDKKSRRRALGIALVTDAENKGTIRES
tara:strand:- start:378 stop:1673 length:1296 start_codon:yes stop_codon:yes gene_type:complete